MLMDKADNITVRFQCRYAQERAHLMLAVFAGKDPSRALAMSSLKPEDCVPDWSDLDDSQKTVLGEWATFFSKRYNVVGKVSSTLSE